MGYHGHFGGWSCLFDKTFTLMIGRLAFERLETELYGVPPKSTDEAAKNREKLYAVAPEVRAGGKEDRRSDIYSVGVVFYEIIYFEFPPYLLTDLTGEGLSIIQGLAERNVSTVEKLKVLEKIRTSTGFAIGAGTCTPCREWALRWSFNVDLTWGRSDSASHGTVRRFPLDRYLTLENTTCFKSANSEDDWMSPSNAIVRTNWHTTHTHVQRDNTETFTVVSSMENCKTDHFSWIF